MICLSSAGGPTSFQMLWKLRCLSTCSDCSLRCSYHQWVHIGKCDVCIECDRSHCKGRVLSCLAIEGHLSHYDLGEERKTHWKKHTQERTPGCQLRSKIWWLTDLQFALLIALRCVLHRCRNLDIHRWGFGFLLSLVSFLLVMFVGCKLSLATWWLDWVGLD